MTDTPADDLVERLLAGCDCADNVDAEQQYDGTWTGRFSTCLACQSASEIARLRQKLEDAEAHLRQRAIPTEHVQRIMERAKRRIGEWNQEHGHGRGPVPPENSRAHADAILFRDLYVALERTALAQSQRDEAVANLKRWEDEEAEDLRHFKEVAEKAWAQRDALAKQLRELTEGRHE